VPSLTAKQIDGHTYYYARYCQRVDGKPKIVRQVYLGKLEDLVASKKFNALIVVPNDTVGIANAVADAIRTNTMSGALAFAATNDAEATRIQLATAAAANAALFTNQIPAYEAAPSVYQQRAYFQALADSTKNTRIYVLLATNTQDVIWLNLEDTISSEMINRLNVPQ